MGEVDLVAGRSGGPNVDPAPRPFSLDDDVEGAYPATGPSSASMYSSSMGTNHPMMGGAAGLGAGAIAGREMEQYRNGGRPASMGYDPYNPQHQMYPGQQQDMTSDTASMSTSAGAAGLGAGGAGLMAMGGDRSSGGGGGGGAVRMNKQQEAARAYAMTHGGRQGTRPPSGSISEYPPSSPINSSDANTPGSGALSSSGGEDGARGGRLGVANPDTPDTDVDINAGSPVRQAQDGGRYVAPLMSPGAEVPPSYDSIPADERERMGLAQ